ncbi:MAG TPA: transposase [Gemmataceae bacterium]|jgi:REP element-mobilizing transposase RayT|nr:transposase [Gemmataceae bacterium]
MPNPGMCWRHVVFGPLNSWLPGDARGFRTRDHKLHSSGDYINPPPPDEHARLLKYSQNMSDDPVILPNELREVVGKAVLKKLQEEQTRVLAIAVAGMHVHCFAELPEDKRVAKAIVGRCKMKSSHAIRSKMPGRVWAGGGGLKRIKTKEYQRRVYRYILRQRDAWIWSF